MFSKQDIIQIMSTEEAKKKRPSLNFEDDFLTLNSNFSYNERMLAIRIQGIKIAIPLKYFEVFEVISLPTINLVITYCPIIDSLTVYTYKGIGKKFYVSGKLYKGSLIFMDHDENNFKHISGKKLNGGEETYLKPYSFTITDAYKLFNDNFLCLYLKNFKCYTSIKTYKIYRLMTLFMFLKKTVFLRHLFTANRNRMVIAILNQDEQVNQWGLRSETLKMEGSASNQSYVRYSEVEIMSAPDNYDTDSIFYRGNMTGLILLNAFQ